MTIARPAPASGLGASAVAAIAGQSPYATPTDVWLEKVGLGRARDETPAMAAGTALERPILRLASDRLGIAFRHNRTAVRHPRWPDVPLWATPDGYAAGRTLLAEVKLVGHRWSDWSDGAPDYVVTQARAQLACLPRADACYVIALLGSELKTVRVERDPLVEARLVELVAGWWQRHVVDELAPDPDGPEDAWNVLRATTSVEARAERLATTDELALGAELLAVAKRIAELERHADDVRRRLAETADQSDLLGLGWTARWTSRASTSWKAVALDAGATAALVDAHTTRTPTFAFRSQQVPTS